MPSCAPASCTLRCRIEPRATAGSRRCPARPSPRASSRRLRSDANSTATKKPLARSSSERDAARYQPVTAPAPPAAAVRRRGRWRCGGRPCSTTSTRQPSCVDDRRPTSGMWPEPVQHEAGQGLVVALGQHEAAGVEHLVGVQRAGEHRRLPAARSNRERRWSGGSCSSSISPTISSRMSSRVMMPAVPPCSSTTIARWRPPWRRSASRSARSRRLRHRRTARPSVAPTGCVARSSYGHPVHVLDVDDADARRRGRRRPPGTASGRWRRPSSTRSATRRRPSSASTDTRGTRASAASSRRSGSTGRAA